MSPEPGAGNALAVLLVISMLASTVPVPPAASQAEDPETPDIRVGELEPGDCLLLQTIPGILERKLERIDRAANNTTSSEDPAEAALDELRSDERTPMVCPGGNDTAFRNLIGEGNAVIRALNGAIQDIGSGVDQVRDETEDAETIRYLFENFTEARHGGLGDWKTQAAGDDTGFRQPLDPRVTEGFALTDQRKEAYEHGLETTTVSPAIDLGAAAFDPAMAKLPGKVHEIVDAQLPRSIQFDRSAGGMGASSEEDLCVHLDRTEQDPCIPGGGENLEETYQAVRDAYVDTGDTLVRTWLRSVVAGTLEVRHRFNLADGLDGVRFEVLTQPPPTDGSVPRGTPLAPLEDSPRRGYDDVASFDGADAFTGYSDGWVVERFDLSPWVGQKVWIVTRAVTDPAFGVPGFFEDPVLFPNGSQDLGYALDGVFVNGSAIPNNLRVVDVDAGAVDIDGKATVPNPLSDGTVEVAVANFGLEEATAEVRLHQCRDGTCTEPRTLGTVSLTPGQIETFRSPFPDPKFRSGEIRLVAEVERADENAIPDTRPDDNTLERTLTVDTVRRVEVRSPSGTTLGLHPDPARGGPEEAREVRLRLANTGNVPLQGTTRLDVRDAETGESASGTVQDGSERQVHLRLGEARTLAWTVLPTEPGVYRVSADLGSLAQFVEGPEPDVHLFADRSPGVVCADDSEAVRQCGRSWAATTDLPDEGRLFDAAARGPGGTLFALARNGSVFTSDGSGWTETTTVRGARELLSTAEGVLVVDRTSSPVLLTRSGEKAAQSPPLDRVSAVASEADGRAVLAGRSSSDIAVAYGHGTSWKTLLLDPDAVTSDGVRVEAVAPIAENRFALALLDRDDGSSTVHVAVAAGAGSATGAEGRFFKVATIPLATEDPSIVALAPAGNTTILLADDPDDEAPGPCSEGVCAYRVPLDHQVDVEGVGRPQGFAVRSVATIGGQSWALTPEDHDTPLYRIGSPAGAVGIEAVAVPGTTELDGLGGGVQGTAAIGGDRIFEARSPAAHLANEGGWKGGVHLEPVNGSRVWTTVFDAENAEAKFRNIGPPETEVFLRGTCFGQDIPGDGTTGQELDRAFNTVDCLDDLTGENDASLKHVNLTFRYNLRKMGDRAPEVRLVFEPGTAFRGGTAPAFSGFLALMDPVTGPWPAGGYQVGFDDGDDGDDDLPVLEEPEAVRDPRTLAVHRLTEPTGADWTTVNLSLADTLTQLFTGEEAKDFALEQTKNLLGVEFAFPNGTEMAVDAAWLNATNTTHDAEETTLLATAASGSDCETSSSDQVPDQGVWRVWPSRVNEGGTTSRAPGLDCKATAYLDDLPKSPWIGADDGLGAWRLSEEPVEPAWAYMGTEESGFEISDSTNGRFDRLATPILDLRQAERSVLSFRHGYAFPTTGSDEMPAAGGWVEARIEQAPGEWSEWTRLHPEGEYPEHPEDDVEVDLDGYWGSNVEETPFADAKSVLDPQHWETATFDLRNQTSLLMGKRIQLGFTAFTDGGGDPYEGWVVSDVRLTGTQRPAVDVGLEEIRFQEGYNVSETGLPPGGTVTLNATVANQGTVESPNGYALTWQLVGVGEEEKIVATGGTPLASLDAGQETWIELPVSVPATFDEDIFGEDPAVYLQARLEPGPAPDEDPLNNLQVIGSRANPFDVTATRDLEARVDVSPARGSPDRPRLVDVQLHNAGNTPLEGLVVERVVLEERGAQGIQQVPGTELTVHTDRTLPAGENRSLAQLVSGLGVEDRLWTPPRTGAFVVSASIRGEEVQEQASRSVVSADPFLRSSVETATTGTVTDGEFTREAGWAAREPGAFGSAQAWTFEPDPKGVPEDGGLFALESPPIDLSRARGATVSFVHNHDLEESFDGARVEASLDGGDTWRPLSPRSTRDAPEYQPVLGGNPLADGNLSTPAFTGEAPEEGAEWALSTFDLSQLPGTVEPGEIARMEMQSMTGNSSLELPAPDAHDGPEHVYSNPSWLRGPVAASEAFLVENLTAPLEDRGRPGFLHTGTVEEIREAETSVARAYEIPVPELETDEEAVLEWWEWAPLLDQTSPGGDDSSLDALKIDDLNWWRGVYADHAKVSDQFCQGDVDISIVEVDGPWRRYRAEVPPGAGDVTVVFQWVPWEETATGPAFTLETAGHPGIVVDDLQLRVFEDHLSGEVNPKIEWQERWSSHDEEAFLSRTLATGTEHTGCVLDADGEFDPGSGARHTPGSNAPFEETDEIEFRDAPWQIVELEDTDNRVLSSSPRSEERSRVFNATPWADTRLVLPALDLRGAGSEVELSFDHLPAFSRDGNDIGGGVVEASVYDSAKGEWGSWEQLYPNASAENGGYDTAADAYKLGFADRETPVKLTAFRGFPSSFDDHVSFNDHSRTTTGRVYVYNTEQWADGDFDGFDWSHEDFDLSAFTGKRVRLAFHAFHTGDCSYEDAYPEDADELGTPWVESDVGACPPDGDRWLVDNVTVSGKAFAGSPIQVRFVAGMDSSVHNASWAVDDIEVVGTSYDDNVGIYTNRTPELVAPGVESSWGGEVRNLGTSIRQNLALRASVDGISADLALRVGDERREATSQATSQRFNLPASGTVPFEVSVTPPEGLESANATLDLEVLHWNEELARFTPVSGEQVRANLERSFELSLEQRELTVRNLTVEPDRVAPGASASVEAQIENPNADTTGLVLTCTVGRVVHWEPVAHDGDEVVESHDPVLVDETAPCEPEGLTRLSAPTGETVQTYQVTTGSPGAYQIRLEVFRESNLQNPVTTETTILWAGQAPRALFESFEDPAWKEGEPTGGWENRGSWSATDEETFRDNRSMLSGIPVQAYAEGENYQTESTSRLMTRPVDLHNVTEGRAHLSLVHMARLAYGDGANVTVRVLENEAAPESEEAWTRWCGLEPEDGYGGFVASFHASGGQFRASLSSEGGGGGGGLTNAPIGAQASGPEPGKPSPDYNPAYPRSELVGNAVGLYTKDGYFGTEVNETTGVERPRWDVSWEREFFPLNRPDGTPKRCHGHALTGSTAQFAFTLYTGEDDDDAEPTTADQSRGWTEPDPLMRGRGQGWFLDSVAVVAANATVSPETVRVPILDAAPKKFPVEIQNTGPTTEHTQVQVDLDRSTLSADQVQASQPLSVEPNRSAVGYANVVLPRDPLSLPFQHQLVVEADGLLDPNRPDESIFQLDFDPRLWPDLSIDIREPETPPVEGVPTLVPVQITNEGRATSPPTQLVLHDRTTGGPVGEPVQVPSLPPASEDALGAATAVFIPWTPEIGGPDTYALEAILDPEDRLNEYSRENNRINRTLEVQPLRLPDLRFQEDNLTVRSPTDDVQVERRGTVVTYDVPAGQPVKVSIPVTNNGSAPARNVDVRLTLGAIPLPAERIDRLEPGDTEEVTFRFLAQEGTRNLRLEISTSSRDLHPSDNRAPLQGILRLTGVSFRVDATLPEQVELGEPGRTSATLKVENLGTTDVLLDLASKGPRGISFEPDRQRVFLDPSEIAEVTGQVVVEPTVPGGTHSLAVLLSDHDDPDQRATAHTTVHLAERHDLNLDLAQQVLPPGPSTIPVSLTNRGNLPETLTLSPLLGDDPIGDPVEVTVPRENRRTVDLEVTVPSTLEPGTHELTITTNGTFSTTQSFEVTVDATARPSIEPVLEDRSFDTDGLTIPVDVENLGNEPLSTRLEADPENRFSDIEVTPDRLELEPGQRRQVDVQVADPGTAGKVTLLLQSPQETVEKELQVSGELPDLTIVHHTLDPERAEPGEPSELRVTVANDGDGPARNVSVDLFVDGAFAIRGQIDRLDAGASRTLPFQWSAFEESRAMKAVVNAEGLVPDADPDNNAISVVADSTGDDSPIARLVENVREVPGPSVGLLIAVALAAALNRHRRRTSTEQEVSHDDVGR